MATPRMTGVWTGEVGGFKFTLDLIQVVDSEHVNGILKVGGFVKSGHITGVNAYPEVALSGMFLDVGAAFNGRFQGADQVSGRLRFQEDVVAINFTRERKV